MGTKPLCNELSSFLTTQIKKSLPMIRTKLMQMSAEKEKDSKNIGMTLNTTNDPSSKAALLISLLNKYNKLFTETLSGEHMIEKD